MAKIAALIVAAGRGERAGGPKQYRALAGQAVLRRSAEAFAARTSLIQVVIGADQAGDYKTAMAGFDALPPVGGGETRQQSARNGLEALAKHAPDLVLIHDAARPLVSPALIERVIAALAQADAAIPLLPVADTLKRETDGRWTTVPRDGLQRAQTPQGFRFDAILKAHRHFVGQDATDDMALAELAGLKIVAVAGEETNMKITAPEDFATAERLLGGGGEFRTGFGFDAHRFAAGDHIWLCGVKLAHDHALEGHSDADAGLHALTDAILGTIGAGDIGEHFPPTDAKWRGATSSLFLEHALTLVRAAGGAVAHCDVTLICERPKIAPHRAAMRARIAAILGLDISRVSVKATTTEGMGFTGRREGIAAQAVATVRFT
ncbi:MAG TPA: bifunctional 2-C-methyl-D-erythritol 4-phosphate cytidylyltransferase/2-C-methyl-D-erythritol 2,4-cyclodiphosphate synthase [Rhizomicrobium sp.]|nr:bifunctional 2-C-methyl-D-erythritol 4-phosphate cytidylyltransferase/2-C-methyl-D-erythritol 2,4-cyclodiphosphate synthase [Rhizomicrobium sp.]